MVWARKGWLAFVFGSVLAAGCTYHTTSAGRERDFAIGDAGCDANTRARWWTAAHPRRQAVYADRERSSPGFLPTSHSVDGVAQAGERGEMPKAERAGYEFPIYVLPPESVANALHMGPHPNPQAGSGQREDVRRAVSPEPPVKHSSF